MYRQMASSTLFRLRCTPNGEHTRTPQTERRHAAPVGSRRTAVLLPQLRTIVETSASVTTSVQAVTLVAAVPVASNSSNSTSRSNRSSSSTSSSNRSSCARSNRATSTRNTSSIRSSTAASALETVALTTVAEAPTVSRQAEWSF